MTLPPTTEELHEYVEEYCEEYAETSSEIYIHEMIDDEDKRDRRMWGCFYEWAEGKHVAVAQESFSNHVRTEHFKSQQ